LLIFSDRIFDSNVEIDAASDGTVNHTSHPRLFQQGAEWKSEECGWLTGDDTVGIYVFPSKLVQNLLEHNVESLADLRAWSLTNELMESVPVEEGLW
jgi:hypothetical protein